MMVHGRGMNRCNIIVLKWLQIIGADGGARVALVMKRCMYYGRGTPNVPQSGDISPSLASVGSCLEQGLYGCFTKCGRRISIMNCLKI